MEGEPGPSNHVLFTKPQENLHMRYPHQNKNKQKEITKKKKSQFPTDSRDDHDRGVDSTDLFKDFMRIESILLL